MLRDIHPAEIGLFIAATLRGYRLAEVVDGGYAVTGPDDSLIAGRASFKDVANLCGAWGRITLREAAERDGLVWPESANAFIETIKQL